ncbi:SMP-30/gluconolactonase/LRE family protein [Streptomyces sp. NPDC054765]
MDTPITRVLTSTDASVGESPVWDAEQRSVHWVDMLAGALHSTRLDDGKLTTLTLPTFVGAVALRRRGGLLAATADGFTVLAPDGTIENTHDFLPSGTRMNDAKCDHHGRMWAGSTAYDFTPGHGALHVLDAAHGLRTVIDGMTQPNGMDWSPDGRVFYLVDSREQQVIAFDYDPDSAQLTRKRTFVSLTDRPGLPDGLCVDASGCLWIAMWGAARLLRLSPGGELLQTLPLPVIQPSSCAFIADQLDVLCVTTARTGLDLPAASDDGSLLAVSGLNVRGLPPHYYAG